MKLGAVVLAAGSSKRFGPRNKLLHAVEGVPLLCRVLDAFEGIGLEGLVVVTGHESERVDKLLGARGIRSVFNPNYKEGVGTSLASGVQSLQGMGLEGVLVGLGDLPGLKREHVASVRAAFMQAGGNAIVQPCFDGKRGHPVCFPARCFDPLLALKGDKGARELIAQEGDRVILVPLESDGCVRDLDEI